MEPVKVFAKYTRNSSTSFTAYEGQGEDVVTALLEDLGATDIEFLEEADYNTQLAAALAAQ